MSHGRLESCSVMWSTSAFSQCSDAGICSYMYSLSICLADCIVVVGGPGGVNYVIQVVLQVF